MAKKKNIGLCSWCPGCPRSHDALPFFYWVSGIIRTASVLQFCQPPTAVLWYFEKLYGYHCKAKYNVRYHGQFLETESVLDKGLLLPPLMEKKKNQFDTMDHSILLARLWYQVGISGSVLEWFRSYLVGKTFCVSLGCFMPHPAVAWCSTRFNFGTPAVFIVLAGQDTWVSSLKIEN